MRIKGIIPGILFVLQLASAQDIVDINLNMKHAVNGVSEFDRSKYIMIHASSTDGEWPNQTLRKNFYENYDVYNGRNNGSMPWNLSQCTEDPLKPGWPNAAYLQQKGAKAKTDYANAIQHHTYENRRAAYMMGGQEGMYPNGEHEFGPTNAKWKMAKGDYAALGEYFANYLKYFHGTGGSTGEPKPTFFEVMNEPFVKASKLGTTRENLSLMHKVVAQRVKELNPDVKVGGYSAAHPAYEAADFKHWETNWKTFIDIAGEEMDYFSLHLYDNYNSSATPQYRSGSNIEAILDMIEHYSYLKLGKVKPFCISELGCLVPSSGTPYTRERDWHNLRSFSTITMQLMEKPDLIAQSLPFLLVKGSWWKDADDPSVRYAFRLFRQKWELEGESGNDWVYTDLVKFYQLWSKVKGTRIDTKPSSIDIQSDMYVDGNKAYLIINNMHREARTLDLVMNGLGDAKVQSVFVKHVYAAENNWIPALDSKTFSEAPSKVNIGREATMILEYTFDRNIEISETSNETKYYAESYYQPIVANQAINFNIKNVLVAANGEAMLRLGMGRDHGSSLHPVVSFNDSLIDVPTDFRGNNQEGRDRFFGVLEIPIPFSIVKDSNIISVTYPDEGGRISSVSMQVYNFSTEISRTGDEILNVSLSQERRKMKPGKKFQLEAFVWPTNYENRNISWTSSNPDIVSVTENGLIEALKEGTAEIIVTTEVGGLKDTCIIEVTNGAPAILAESITISPRSKSILMNTSASLSVSMLPLDVDNTIAAWSSRDTFIAAVDASGLITAKNIGITTILATTTDGSSISDSIPVTVTPLPNSVDCNLFPSSLPSDSILEFDVKYTLGDTMDIAVELVKASGVLPWIAEGQITTLPGEGTTRVTVNVKNKTTGEGVIPNIGSYALYARVRDVGGDAGTNSKKCLKSFRLSTHIPNAISDHRLNEVTIYPNPANHRFTLHGDLLDIRGIAIFNMQGKQCCQFEIKENNLYDISALPKGGYLVKLYGDQIVRVRKLMKN